MTRRCLVAVYAHAGATKTLSAGPTHRHSPVVIYTGQHLSADTGHLMNRITTSDTEGDCITTVCDCIETLQYGGRAPVQHHNNTCRFETCET